MSGMMMIVKMIVMIVMIIMKAMTHMTITSLRKVNTSLASDIALPCIVLSPSVEYPNALAFFVLYRLRAHRCARTACPLGVIQKRSKIKPIIVRTVILRVV